MDYQDIIVSCKSCELKVPMSKTRFDSSGSCLICLKCYKDIYGLNGEKIVQTADPNRLNFSCNNCGYKFSRNKEFSLTVCPYCSKQSLQAEGVVVVKAPDKRISDY